MPQYPRVEPYVALKQGIEYEERAELNCGCVMQDHEDGVSIELYFCTLHNGAQQLLDVLAKLAIAAYQDLAGAAIACAFCTSVRALEPDRGVTLDHQEDCVMNEVHEAIRTARLGPKGGDAQQAG